MCGRLNIQKTQVETFRKNVAAEVVRITGTSKDQLQLDLSGLKEGEIAPTESVLLHRIEAGHLVEELAYWTLVPPWVEAPAELAPSRDGRLRLVAPPRTHFNSRRDTLVRSAGWRKLLAFHRCVVVVDGFWEWSDSDLLPKGQPGKVGRFRMQGGRPMVLAGIWSPARIQGDEVQTCSVVTTSPNSVLESLPHHRMPAILEGADLEAWLDPDNSHPETALHLTLPEELEAQIEILGMGGHSSSRLRERTQERLELPL
jgi:putative SOS response-associated peptidase YedK